MLMQPPPLSVHTTMKVTLRYHLPTQSSFHLSDMSGSFSDVGVGPSADGSCSVVSSESQLSGSGDGSGDYGDYGGYSGGYSGGYGGYGGYSGGGSGYGGGYGGYSGDFGGGYGGYSGGYGGGYGGYSGGASGSGDW